MKTLSIKLNQEYRLFKKNFEQELEGDLIIISGANGSGKTQLLSLINKKTANITIDTELKSNGIIITEDNIVYRSFRDNINIPAFKSGTATEKDQELQQIYQNWNNYIDYSRQRSYKQLKGLQYWGSFNKLFTVLSSAVTPKLKFTDLNSFRDALPNDFVFIKDDIFTSNVGDIFYQYAAEEQDEAAKCGRNNILFNQNKWTQNAPWTKLNSLFKRLNFSYRFKEKYIIQTPNLDEPPKLYELKDTGEISTNSVRNLIDLSDGEKAILSLTFATLSENHSVKVILLDEFDAPLNPSLVEMFYIVLDEFFIKKDIQVIMATHSPATISLAPEVAKFYEIFKSNASESPKIFQVKKEEYAELRIANKEFYDKIGKQKERIAELEKQNAENLAISASTKPILFVEDKYTNIYKVAYLKCKNIDFEESSIETVFEQNAVFQIISKGSCNKLQGFLSGLLSELKGIKIIGLFDFDDAYLCYTNLKDDKELAISWEIMSTDEKTGMYKKRKDEDIYALMLPVPDFRKSIANKDQAVKKLEAELLLRDEDIQSAYSTQTVAKEKIIEGLEIPKIKNKDDFWKKSIVIEANKFDSFNPLFGLIDTIFCNNGDEKKEDKN